MIQILKEFGEGIDDVADFPWCNWLADHLVRSGLSQTDLAMKLKDFVKRPQFSKMANGKQRISYKLRVILVQFFAKWADENPAFVCSAPPAVPVRDAVLGGWLYALNAEGNRGGIVNSRCGPLYFFCLQGVTTDRAWHAAVASKDRDQQEIIADRLIADARALASRVRFHLPPFCELYHDCRPDEPAPAGADDLHKLLRTWKKPWAKVHIQIPRHLRVE